MTNTRVRRFRSTPAPIRRGMVAALLCTGLAACADGAPDTIDRERFIDTYVDLRVTAIESDSQQLSDEDRTAVLARNGVTEDELFTFAEVHGRDVAFMAEIWNEIEARLDATHPEADER